MGNVFISNVLENRGDLIPILADGDEDELRTC